MFQGLKSRLELWLEIGQQAVNSPKSGYIIGGYTFTVGMADINGALSILATLSGTLLSLWLLWMHFDEWKENKKTRKLDRRKSELEVEHLEALKKRRQRAG